MKRRNPDVRFSIKHYLRGDTVVFIVRPLGEVTAQWTDPSGNVYETVNGTMTYSFKIAVDIDLSEAR